MSEQPERAVTLDKGDGDTPAMNRPGPHAAADRAHPAPGNRGWDEPAEEAPESIEGAVRTDDDPMAPGRAIAADGVDGPIPEPDEPA